MQLNTFPILTAKRTIVFDGFKLFKPDTMHLNKPKSLKVVKLRDENLVYGCQDGGHNCVQVGGVGCGEGGGGGGCGGG